MLIIKIKTSERCKELEDWAFESLGKQLAEAFSAHGPKKLEPEDIVVDWSGKDKLMRLGSNRQTIMAEISGHPYCSLEQMAAISGDIVVLLRSYLAEEREVTDIRAGFIKNDGLDLLDAEVVNQDPKEAYPWVPDR